MGLLFFKLKNIFNINSKIFYPVLFILCFSILSISTNAIIDSNYGTAMRHRMIFMPILFIVAIKLNEKQKPEYVEYVA